MYNSKNRKNPKTNEYRSVSVSEMSSESLAVCSCGECGGSEGEIEVVKVGH